MNLKELIRSISDPEMSLHGRMFRLLESIGIIALFIAGVVGFLLGETGVDVIVMLVASIFFAIITWIGVKKGKVDFCMHLIILVMMFVVIPIGFFLGGGIYGGSPIWFVFGFVMIALLLSNKERKCYFILQAIITSVSYAFAYFHPGLIKGHTNDVAYIDSYASVILLSCIICVMIIFQQKAYQQKSRHSEEQRREIYELNQAQNRFFSSMSHEIRTPINTIIGLNEMNLREELSYEVEENSIHIQSASRILLSLINDILDMSKIESGKMSIVEASFAIGTMLSEVVGMIWPNAKDKGLAFHVDVDKTLPTEVIGDEVRIKQILINILSNAVKYTQDGSVGLSVQCQNKTNGIATISFAVKDTGIGIKKENIPYLFNAFRREDEGKNRYIEGTGLGLAIVKQLIVLMNGEIQVNSVYTQGSSFVVTLPLKIGSEEELGALDLAKREISIERDEYRQRFVAPQAHILLVDDNEVNLLVAEKLLRKTEVVIDSVTSGAECLGKTLSNHYDLIFMDHLMPEMDGVECLHMIRNQVGGRNQETPVIVLTANAGSDLLAMYHREGFDDCITKPVTGEVIEEGILAHLPKELVSMTYTESLAVATDSPVMVHNRKKPIIISVESICDLPENILQARQIAVIPYSINTDEGYFLDGKEIESEGVISYLISGRNAMTKEPDVKAYEEFFSGLLQQATQVLHISASRKMNPAFGKAMEAAGAFNNVMVIDSGQMSSGVGLIALHAWKLAEEGKSLGQIRQGIERLKSSIRTTFVLDTVKFLANSGRVPRRAQTMSEAFMLHPVVEIQEGIMKPRKMEHGSLDDAWIRFLKMQFANSTGICRDTLFITYSGLSMSMLDEIKTRIEQYIHFDKVVMQKVSASSATMFGPKAFGLIYVKERNGETYTFDLSTPQISIDRIPAIKDNEVSDEIKEAGKNKAEEIMEWLQEESNETTEEASDSGKNDMVDGLPEWMNSVKELNISDGIMYCASAEGYMEALDVFNSTIRQKADEIENFYQKEDWASYTIKVHALKSSAKIIGASELSEEARLLELAGKEDDIDTIRKDTGRLLENYRKYITILAPLNEEATPEEEKKDIPEEILQDAYQSMMEFVDQMDYNLTEMVLQSLAEYRLPEEDANKVAAIRDALNILDWDRIKELL